MSPRALKGAFINYERGLGGRRMGDLRGGGDLNSFYTEKGRGGGPEMLPEHWGENLKY